MIGIQYVSAYLPSGFIDNALQAKGFDADEDFIRHKIGMLQLSRKADTETTSHMAVQAVLKLQQEHGVDLSKTECLVLVTQNPDGHGLPHTSAVVHHRLNLPSACAVFDISLGCSGFVQALSVAKAFMQSQNMRHGLLVTADPYSKIINPLDRDTAMLFGDGASATWLSEDGDWQIGVADFGIQSQQHDALQTAADGHLFMNGRAVFTFAATQVPASVKRVLEKAQLGMADLDQVFLHQGSRYIVDTLAKRIGAEGKTPFAATTYGNTVSSSVPMMLAQHLQPQWRKVLLCGFGVGLSWATCLLEKNNDHS
jgi:3-oxoacyl-[acyl-carrier-protein] synthase-3